ncbi:MAG: bifunctional DNA-formamidopyrimidine glycosylase/DNA-(apurinic or apyrimidinic site) lyase [Candidatus Nomurabacteria bacterium]|jgi:formamidopyrimidine-DNA glycosylase|nr:bifunctional DNA-formamidopyrimidine glycosylase/DNA-(apurinic or apyrimidinic site) lyase [Candidatus Nomurabacteria bacterium]
MPELPEVETVRRGLARLIVGRPVLDVKVYNPKSFQASSGDTQAFLVGARVVAARRRAKVLIIDLDSGYSLVAHLKMTGQLVFRGGEAWAAGHPTDSFVAELPDRSTRVEFRFDDDSRLFFNDQRKFGWIKLLPTIEVENIDFLKKVGPEPLSGDPKLVQVFLKNIRRRNNTVVKAAILDQTVVAGIGNIYADESLWAARTHPATRVRDLSDIKLRQILRAAIEVMTRSIESGGSTMKNYIRADGTKGDYLEKFAKVFRREGRACPRCGSEIVKIRVAGRGTHICPRCQKLPAGI